MIDPIKMIGLTFVSSLRNVNAIATTIVVTSYFVKLIRMFIIGIE